MKSSSFTFSCAIILSSVLGSTYAQAQSSYTQTAFVPPVTPGDKKSSTQKTKFFHPPSSFPQVRIVQGAAPTIGRNGNLDSLLPLFAKKKKKDTTVGKSGKIQVKLLKHIAGTGQAGDVIMVAPAFFANKLQKTGSAVRISDEEVEKDNAQKAEAEQEAKQAAEDLKHKLEEMGSLNLARKAGPDGQLFGGIGYKNIFSELKNSGEFPKGALDAKWIKITGIKTVPSPDEEGNEVKGVEVDGKHGIKATGDYIGTIALLKGVSANFKISVTPE